MPKSFFENIPKSTAHPVFAGEGKIIDTKLAKLDDGRKYYAHNVRVLAPAQMKNKTIYMSYFVATEDDTLAKEAETWKRFPNVQFGNVVRAARPEMDLSKYSKATDMDKANADMKGKKIAFVCTVKNDNNNFFFAPPGTIELGMGISKAQPLKKGKASEDSEDEDQEELEVDTDEDESDDDSSEDGDDEESSDDDADEDDSELDSDSDDDDDDESSDESDEDDEDEPEPPRRRAKPKKKGRR